MDQPSIPNYKIGIFFILLILLIAVEILLFDRIRKLEASHLEEIGKDILLALIPITAFGLYWELSGKKDHERIIKDAIRKIDQEHQEYLKKVLPGLIEKEFEKIELKINMKIDDVNRMINEKTTPSLERVRKFGIVDVFENQEQSRLWDRIENGHGEGITIRFKSIWIPNLHNRANHSYSVKLLYSIINKKNSVKILLVHPDFKQAIEARAKVITGMKKEDIISEIRSNIYECLWIRAKLKRSNIELANKIKLHLHKNFIANPIVSINEDIYLGHYLPDRPSFQGPQIKLSGDKFFTQRINDSFNFDWEHSEEVDLDNQDLLKRLLPGEEYKQKITAVFSGKDFS